MKNHIKKLCSLGAILSIALSILTVPGMFSTKTFASSMQLDLGTIEVASQKDGKFPDKCTMTSVENGVFSVSSLNNFTNFILNLYDSGNNKFSSLETVGKGEFNFSVNKINPCYFGVSNKANESDQFSGTLLAESDGPIIVQCISSASSIKALSAAFIALITGFTAIFS